MRCRAYLLRFSALILASGPSLMATGEEAPKKPNILMICLDDLNDWTGCLGGHPEVKTPNIDRLAERGRNFINAHCVVPVCSASRVSIMSGLHATTHGSYEFGPSYQSLPALREAPCLQAWFKSHGYRTFAGGKVLHHGFQGPLKEAIDVDLGPSGGPRRKTGINWPGGPWDWGAYPEKDEQMPDFQLAQKTATLLKQKQDRPFFISVGIFRPHVPLLVPPRWFDLYDRETLTLPMAPKSDLSDLPPNLRGKINVEPVHEEVVRREKWRDLVQAYLASVSFADHCVGTILEGLDNGPHAKDTIVVLWSDHGFHLGEKHQWAKRTLWEESTRVPFLFAGPGIEPGPCREAVSLLDLYPTLTELCDLPKPKRLDGLSLTPQLRNPREPRSRPVVISSFEGNHAIRTRDWRLIRYADGARELYDHRKDPDEFTNLASGLTDEQTWQSLAKWLPKNAAPEFRRKK